MVVTTIQMMYDSAGHPSTFSPFIQQHQVVLFERLQRLEHKIFATKLCEVQAISNSPCLSGKLDPTNVQDEKLPFVIGRTQMLSLNN